MKHRTKEIAMKKFGAILLAGATLLAGVNLASAQALTPTPQEGGALPPSGD